MAAAAIIRLLLDGTPPSSGARAAATVLELSHYQPWFAGKRIVAGFRETSEGMTLYRRILGSAWHALPRALQAMHVSPNGLTAVGEAQVERGRNPLVRLAADIMRFPKPGKRIPLRVKFEPVAHGEIWERDFAGRKFRSVQTAGKGRSQYLIDERFGFLSVALACVVKDSKMHLVVRRWSLFGIPMPRFLSPGGEAFEFEQDGRFNFDVELKAPLLGRLVRYRGWLVPE